MYLYLCIWICVFVFVYLNLWMCMRKRTASFIWKINPILEIFWNCYLIQCMIEILKTFIEKRWTKKHPYLIVVASITIFCVKLHSDIDWCCIAARHFLSQNYAVLSVKFASVKNMTNMRYGNIPERPFRYLDCGGFLLNYHLSSEWIPITPVRGPNDTQNLWRSIHSCCLLPGFATFFYFRLFFKLFL